MKKLQEGALKADNTPYSAEEIKATNDFIDLVEQTSKEATANMITKEEAEQAIQKAIEEATGTMKAQLEKTYKAVLEQGTTISKLKATGSSTVKSRSQVIKEAISENKETIKEIANGSTKELVIKADTTRASITDTTSATLLPEIGQLGVKRRSLYNVAQKLQLSETNNQGTIRYIDWDESTTARAAAMRAEGALFPESTAKFIQYTIDLKKVGDTLPVTAEFFEDEALAAAELEMFLNVNVDSVIDDQIVNGDGTSNNLKGLLASVPTYTATAAGIADANIYDLITKMSTGITFNRGSKYNVSFAAMNKNTIDALILKKDANNNYQFPTNHPIYSMIIEDNNIADNVLVVGDGRYMRIYEKPGVVMSKGEPANQFLEDMMTLKARKRLLFLIRTVDQTGFLKCTDIEAALATLNGTVIP